MKIHLVAIGLACWLTAAPASAVVTPFGGAANGTDPLGNLWTASANHWGEPGYFCSGSVPCAGGFESPGGRLLWASLVAASARSAFMSVLLGPTFAPACSAGSDSSPGLTEKVPVASTELADGASGSAALRVGADSASLGLAGCG